MSAKNATGLVLDDDLQLRKNSQVLGTAISNESIKWLVNSDKKANLTPSQKDT